MPQTQTVHLYLEEPLRQSAEAGTHNFIGLMAKVLEKSGLEPVYAPPPTGPVPTNGYSLTHMAEPPNAQGLVFRRVYHYPFWQIDAVAERWRWDVAQASFDPSRPAPNAPRFYGYWQNRLFGHAPSKATRDGFVYVPLQGKLDRQRAFQSCTPLEMIEQCLDYAKGRQVIATLHPKEQYTPTEHRKLNAMAQRHSQLIVDTGNMERYLSGCDYVVTQNSSAAFSGFFFGKSALLFGEIDFHHITVRADLTALGDSFARVEALTPDYATYVWWFWQQKSINAGRADAEAKITARLKRYGWPIKGP